MLHGCCLRSAHWWHWCPFVYIWKILRDVLNAAPDYAQAVNIPHYGWMAVLFAVLSYLIYIAALMCSPSVSVPGGDQSAAGGVGASGGAAAGLCRNFWQRQAAQDHPRKHRSRRDLSGPPAARPVQRHRHPGGAAGFAAGIRLAAGAAEPCAGGAGVSHHGDHDRQADG